MSKWLKRLGAVVVVLALVLVVGGWMLPSTFSVSRSVVIAAPADAVYARVASPKAWPQWSVWNKRDPAMKITYTGPESGTGAGWSWVSASQGNGSMKMTAAEPGRRVAFELLFEDFGTASQGEITFAPEGGGTKVTWTMNGDMGRNPLFHWFALNADRMIGPDFADGLANLKAVAEAK